MVKKAARVAGAAADRDGAVRLIAVHGGQAERLQVATEAQYGGIRIRTGRACCRSCSKTAMGYERYVDYALDVPMYFVYRDGKYIDVAGASFRTFMRASSTRCRASVRRSTTV